MTAPGAIGDLAWRAQYRAVCSQDPAVCCASKQFSILANRDVTQLLAQLLIKYIGLSIFAETPRSLWRRRDIERDRWTGKDELSKCDFSGSRKLGTRQNRPKEHADVQFDGDPLFESSGRAGQKRSEEATADRSAVGAGPDPIGSRPRWQA
jgi:hypothetical protein